MQRLTARKVAALRKRPGRYSDGWTGLMLFARPNGRASWVQRIVVNGRRVDRGLGPVDAVPLAEARSMAWDNKLAARRGEDPFGSRRSAAPTFAVACRRAAEASPLSAANEISRRRALERYCGAIMGRRLDTIRRADLIGILAPLLGERPALGSKLKGWIRGAFAWGVAREHLEHNPADGIAAALPKRTSNGEHRPALPYAELPAALVKVNASTAGETVKAAIAFLIATATRSGEVRGAAWDEVDLDGRVWTIPATRTKVNAAHRVPLSAPCVAILEAMQRHRGDGTGGALVFPSTRGRVLGASTLLKAWQAATGTTTTLHGTGRAGFRTWAAERTDAVRDVMEAALGHAIGGSVERSYARSDLFEKRRALMDQWAEYVCFPEQAS